MDAENCLVVDKDVGEDEPLKHASMEARLDSIEVAFEIKFYNLCKKQSNFTFSDYKG